MSSQTLLYKKNVNKMYAFGFVWMFLVLIPVVVPYFQSFGLSMRNIFELQVILGIVVAVFEVPSGYISDLWGRKNTLIVGSLFYGVGFSYLVFADQFWQLVIFEVLTGISISLVSGADMSLLYDSLKLAKGERDEFTHVVANNQFYKTLSESIAAILGGALAAYSFASVVKVHAFVSWLPLLVALTLVEPPIEKMKNSQHIKNFKMIMKHIFLNDRLVRLLFLNLTLWGISTFVAVWVFQKHWMDSNISLFYFGLLWALYNVTVGIVGKFVHKWENKYGAAILIVALSILPVAGYLGLSFFSGWLGVCVGLSFQVARGINQVLLRDAFNWRVPSEFRSTANSISSLFFRLGFALIGPLVGISIDRWGLSPSLQGLAIFFALFLILLTWPLLKEIKTQKIAS